MKIRITHPHITADGPVAVDSILDLPDAHAASYLNAKLGVLHKEDSTEKATNRKPKETATSK